MTKKADEIRANRELSEKLKEAYGATFDSYTIKAYQKLSSSAVEQKVKKLESIFATSRIRSTK